MYVKQLNFYTVAQLKEELTKRELDTTGKKAELVVRLAGYLEEHDDDEMVEALALGLTPSKKGSGTPSKADTSQDEVDEEADTSVEVGDETVEVEETEDVEVEEKVEEGTDQPMETEEAKPVEEKEVKEDKDTEEKEDKDTEEKENKDTEEKENKDTVEEVKENGDTVEQSIEEAMGDTSDLKVLDEVGPDDDEAEKKEEKKKKKKRRLMSWPKLDELLLEKRLKLKQRTLVIGPVAVSDLDNEGIKELANAAESFVFKTQVVGKTENVKGVINACLKDKETCEAFVEKLSGFRDDVRVEQCGWNMSQEKFLKELLLEEDEGPKPEKIENRIVVIRNLDEEIELETLTKLFPDAPNMNIVRDQEGKCKGWSYVEFETSKEGQEFIDTYRNKSDDERPKLDDEFLRVGTLQHIGRLHRAPVKPVEKKEKEEKEVPKERPEGMLSDEERIRKPQLVRMWKQRLQNLEPLKKTRPEYYEKQKKALEENIKKAEEAVEADDKLRKEHGIPIPDPKKEAAKKEVKTSSSSSSSSTGMKRKAPSTFRDFTSDRKDRFRRDMRNGGGGMNRMTREQWQRNRSSWGSGGSSMYGSGADSAGQRDTANAVNLLVGLSKIFGNQGAGASNYSSMSSSGYGGGSSFSNNSSSMWGSGGASRSSYMDDFGSGGSSSFKSRPRVSTTPRMGSSGGMGRSSGSRSTTKTQNKLDEIRQKRR